MQGIRQLLAAILLQRSEPAQIMGNPWVPTALRHPKDETTFRGWHTASHEEFTYQKFGDDWYRFVEGEWYPITKSFRPDYWRYVPPQ